MFRPVPDAFLGSTRPDVLPGGRLTDTLTRCFAILAVLGALAVGEGAYLIDGHANPFVVLDVGFCALLALSISGAWLTRKLASEPQCLTARLYAMTMDRLSETGPLAVPHAAEDGIGCVAGLIGQLVRRTRRLAEAEQMSDTVRRAVSFSRAQTGRLTDRLRDDAAALTEAAEQVGAAGSHIGREMTANAGALALSDTALGNAADALDRLTDRVQATTACAEQMTRAAAQLSEVAHSTHRAVAEHDDKSIHLVVAMDQIEHVIQAALHSLAEAARQYGSNPESQDGLVRLAGEMRATAGQLQPVLAAAHAVIRDLVSETSAANRRAIALCETITEQHELGHAIGHAVQQQSEDIKIVLNGLYEARSGFAVLRASVDAVTRASTLQAGVATRMRETALRLPSQAERMAEILRGIPDFNPSANM